MARFTGVLGILAVLLAAWLFSTDRRRIRWRTIVWGLGLQITFAFLVLRFGLGRDAMAWAGGVVTNMLSATFAGTQVLFGELGLPNSGAFGNLLGAQQGRHLRLSGSAHHHLHLRIFRGALSHRRDAENHSRAWPGSCSRPCASRARKA